MIRTVSKVQSFIKGCCRFVSSQNTENLINVKQKVVYGGDVSTPTYKNSFGSLLFSRLMQLNNDEPLQVCQSTKLSMTAKNLIKKSVAVAQRLQEEGIKKGDVVVLIGDNSLNLNVALTGIFILGAVPAPISTKTKRAEFEILLKSVLPKFFFIDRRFIVQVKGLLDEQPQSQKYKLSLLNEKPKEETDRNIEPFGEFIKDRGKNFMSFKPPEVENPENELALVMRPLTQGAVGRLVGITHHNINSLIARFDSTSPKSLSRHVILMVQKMAWMSGLYSFFISCCYGAKLIVMSKFNEEKFMEAIEEYKVTASILYSFKVWLLYKHEYNRQYDVSSLKYILSIDGSMPPYLIQGMEDKLGINLRPSYGISELTGLVLLSLNAGKLGSTGKLALGTYGKVVSEKTNHKVGPKELGILCFKGPTLTKGYINDKKSTQVLFDKEGFLVSEMYGYYDEEGYFYVLDKVHNVIRYKSCEISPRELEGIIKVLDEVKDVAVAGIQHPSDGYWPLAIVVLRPKSKLTAEAIIKHVDGVVEDCKKLRGGVIFISKIPRSKENGTIKRYLIDKVLSKYRIPGKRPPVESATSTSAQKLK